MNGEMRTEKSTGPQTCGELGRGSAGRGEETGSNRKFLWGWGWGDIPAGRAASSKRVTVCEWADAWQSTGFFPAAHTVGLGGGSQTKKRNHRAWLLPELPKLPSHCLGVRSEAYDL